VITVKNDTQLEKAVLVGLDIHGRRFTVGESLDELERLAATAGAVVVGRIIKRADRPDPRFLIGSGKVEEVRKLVDEREAELVIVDEDLNPTQLRNLEKSLGNRVIDRTQLILDIFARAARTREGKLQVELAQCEYLLPRLIGLNDFLSRLGGGIGTKGPGETKLETDRRRVRRRIQKIKTELEGVRKMRRMHREARKAVPLPMISLVGYTNAGKSTLMNRLTGSSLLAEDKLFSTLDPTTRRLVLPSRLAALLTDTVGFIEKLPLALVSAFRATLEELEEADLILHIVDISSPWHEEQEESVLQTLEELGCHTKPRLVVFNKLDAVAVTERPEAGSRQVAISALTGENIPALLSEIESALAEISFTVRLRLPWREGSTLAFLRSNARILTEESFEGGYELEVVIAKRFMPRIASFVAT
jgi:GTPase